MKQLVMKPQYSKLTFCVLLLLLSICGNALAATLTSKVNRNQLSVDETLTLLVDTDEQINSTQFDTSTLEADFDVISISPQSNSSVAMINGSVTVQNKTSWNITLAPKRVGQLTIPAFEIGTARSTPIRIKVTSARASGNNQPLPLSATITAQTKNAHIGEQILIKIELSSGSNVGNLNGLPLELANADVQVLEQQQEQRIDNGIERQIITINYAVFPTQPGTLTIPAQTYTGREGNSRSVFATLARRGKRIVARTQALNIEVAAAQNKANTAWFPADHVSISSKWSRDASSITVGEPITRTITIVAKGQLASVIPPLPHVSSNQTDYKSYQDQPQLDNQLSPNGVLSARVESQAIVPSAEGLLVLPAQTIAWWNTELDEWDEATLPAETLSIKAGQASATIAPSNELEANGLSQLEANTKLITQENPWWKILTALFGLLSLIQGYFIWRISKRPIETSRNVSTALSNDATSAWNTLNQALKAQHPRETRQHLLEWAHLIAPKQARLTLSDIVNLSKTDQVKQELGPLLHALDAQLYKPTGAPDSALSTSDYQKLTKVLLQLKQERKNEQHQHTIPNHQLKPLYPN